MSNESNGLFVENKEIQCTLYVPYTFCWNSDLSNNKGQKIRNDD